MNSYVLSFQEIDKTKLMMVGGKGANLGELARIEGIRVPEGFCVTTEAYQKIIGQALEFNDLLDQLTLLKVSEREKIGEISGKIRGIIEGIAIAEDIAVENGLPAVVGVENAIKLIKDGQSIRVNGTEGYVEILNGGSSV
jgi:pyruvate,water dikinase